MPYTYRNRNTGDIYTVSERDPRLDALANWELLENVAVSERDLAALERAAAERRLIEDCYQRRMEAERAKVAAKLADTEAVLAATAGPVAPVAPAAVKATLEALPPRPQPKAKPRTPEELQAQADHDLANPPRSSVLARAYLDQKTGAVQIGDNPDEHPRGQAQLEAQAAYDLEHPRERVLQDPKGPVIEPPARNAKRADWVAYAAALGFGEADTRGLGRDELVARFGA